MKKIIAAFDGLKFSESAMEYAIYVAKESGAHLVGIFLDDATYSSYKIYELLSDGMVDQPKLQRLVEKDSVSRRKVSANFETACKKAGINFSIHHDRKIAVNELVHESIYADLLIINSKETLTHYSEEPPTRFIRSLLADVQCPVLVVPDKFTVFKRNILLYDGAPSSVYAVKMLDYTLAFLKNTATEVLSVKDINSTLHLPYNKLMKEFMKRHYPDAKYKVVQGFPETEIIKYLKEQPAGTLITLGAYRRGTVSRFFRQSMADSLMIEIKLPLFIAHNK
ncbi:MAG TPA: universal stress protein [Chitinophagaceae bacterium]|nr:universal stress protein [Chitinophagaceae bacterium]